MYPSTYLKWFRRLLILGAVVAGLTASAAGARLDPGTPPDVSDAAFQVSVTPATDVSRPPDVRDATGSVTAASPDVFERYAAAHPYGFDPISSELVSSPPDVRDAASALHSTAEGVNADGLRWQGIAEAYMQLQSTPTELVSSPPDVQDAASALHSTPAGLKADGLRWQGIAQAYQQVGTSDPVTRILAQESGRRLDQSLFTSTPTTKVVDSGGFDWNDYAIGIGTGIGVALLLGAGLMFGRQQRHRMQPA